MSANQELRIIPGALQVPDSQQLASVTLWCEYAVWGLLFHDDQSPWLTLVECLHVCFHQSRSSTRIVDETCTAWSGKHEQIRYASPSNHNLRHLLFRDQDILKIADMNVDDALMWRAWEERRRRDNVTLEFDYLEKGFESFRDMANAVELLRSAEIDSQNLKRWTSRHLLPLGDRMLFPDVGSIEKNNMDRKFMRRTGELLYLMINRSTQREEVATLIADRLVGMDTPWNRLADQLGGTDPGTEASANMGYLPLPRHRTYDDLARDWISLLQLKRVPVENILDPLARLSGLAQISYIVHRAVEQTGDKVIPPFFLDMIGTGKNPVRKLSSDQHKRHRALIQDAMSGFVDEYRRSPEWQACVGSGHKEQAKQLIAKRFKFNPGYPSDPDRLPLPEEQLTQLRSEVQSPRTHSISSAFKNHARLIGLLRSYARSGTWYSLGDGVLEALVLATVTFPMEYGQFLRLLYERYLIVVGPEEVRAAFQVGAGPLPAPLADLQENERKLEERLRMLGLLDRKSDDCAFVLNPFFQSERYSPETEDIVRA